jgi:hypothetical protein
VADLTDPDTAARSAVIGRYACRQPSGRIESCHASGKVVYGDRSAAENAARELEQVGSRPLRAYRCDHGHGHWHTATDHARPVIEPIPQRSQEQCERAGCDNDDDTTWGLCSNCQADDENGD